jgi:ferredoxin
MTRNVVVLTNFRTGSTSFTLKKSDEYRLPYKGELFSHERPHPIGKLPAKETVIKEFGYPAYSWVDTYLSRWNLFQELKDGASACYKIMPSHFDEDYDQLASVLAQADKVYYLYRRDLMAQVKSWMEVRHSGSFSQTGFKTNTGEYSTRMHQLHRGTLKVGETYRNTIDPNDPLFTTSKTNVETKALVTQLDRNYQAMGLMYKKVPGVLVCYEDYFSGDLYKPYNREIKWTSEPQIDEWVTEWTIENYFK